ncbi:MAG: FISUMP domain-containing protein, partial [Flavobacteriales bacterium]
VDITYTGYAPNVSQLIGGGNGASWNLIDSGICAYDCVTSECGEIYPLMNFGYEVSSCPGVDVIEGNNQSSDEPFVYFIINSGADNNYDLTVGSNTQEIVIYVGSGNGNSVDITYTGYAPNVSQLIGGGNGASWNLIDNNIYGCMDVAACNYDDTATGGDSSCIFDVDECGVCNGDNSTCPDCAGVVNGDALIQGYFFDADGDGLGYGKAVQYCSGSVPTCTDGDGVETGCWVLNDYDSYPDCYSNNVDCNGTCDGYEVVNGCGECGGDEWALWYADIDGDGLGDPNAEISSCDYIEGYVIWNNSDPDDNCFSNVFDACGVCGGDNSTCTDCAGVVSGEAVEDCAGVCGGTSVIDECGVCGGDNSTCADCCGVPNGDGTTCDGVCGNCNDDTSCYGCTYAAATNYDSTATIDNGSCVYAVCDITSDNQAVYDGAYAAGIASVVCPDGGSSCPGDLDNDGAVATTDLLIFLSAYGGTCEVDEDLGFSVCGDDINHEGYDYSTVLIGDQCWFAENSRYLPEVSPSSASSETSPLYYVYGYEGTDVAAAMSTSNYETYGVLYNWPAVMTEDICPSGWHIPSDGEWQTMEISLGMPEAEAANEGWRGTEVAYQMKSTFGWNDYNGSSGNGSNSSGFDGRPGGYADSGGFSSIGNDGNWWSSAPSNSNPFRRALFYYSDNVFRGNYFINNGLSARCVIDYTDECGVVNGDNSTCADDCGIPNGDNSTCLGCDGVPNSGLVFDECEVCGGDNSTCLDECGLVNGDNSTCLDECGIPNGDNSSCFTSCGDDIEHESYNYSTVLIGDQCWFSENCRY